VADSGAAFGDPFSPTHRVRVTREEGRLEVRPEGELSGDTIATHRPAGDDGYFMLTLSPGRADGAVQPRDLTVVLDVSGSMSGTKIEQAKAALRQLLASLGSQDRFRLLAFSNGVRAHRSEWTDPTRDELADARRWIAGLHADGGTNVAGALSEAFRLESPAERLPIVVFLTDGLPSVGERNPERIAAQAEGERGRARVFAFGVGYDVNTYAKIQHPVLTDIAVGEAPVELVEIHPATLPDLFSGEELVVFGRYRTSRTRSGELTVSGRRNNRAERFTTRVTFPEHELANDFIPRLWASRKIGALAQELRLHGMNQELVEEIRRTALRYGLLSEFTSYLVQEPEEFAQGPVPRDVRSLAAPSAAVGEGAVAAAKQDRARREARTEMELADADEDLLSRGHLGQTRHVAGRLFAERHGVWTDLAHRDSLRTVEIAPYGDAYFALLQHLPEVKPYFGAFGSVLVAGEQVSIRLADGGRESLSQGELDRLVREFRGP
jgi:Ca-activated chloride channel family protein